MSNSQFPSVIASEAKQSIVPAQKKEWIASSLPLPCANALRFSQAMTSGYTCAFSRRQMRPSCARILHPSKNEGAGNTGCAAGTRSLACEMEKAHERSHRSCSRNTRHSLRNGFNGLLRALPGDRAFLPPSPPRSLLLKNLASASGCQDHTTSPSAVIAPSSEAQPASTASHAQRP